MFYTCFFGKLHYAVSVSGVGGGGGAGGANAPPKVLIC